MRAWLLNTSLLDGWLPVTVAVVAVPAVAFLLLRLRGRRRWWIAAAVAVAVGIGVAFLAAWAIIDVFNVWPEALPDEVVWWAAAGISALLLGLAALVVGPRRWWRLLLTPAAVVVVVALAALQINTYYGAMPTVGDLLGQGAKYQAGIPRALAKTGTKDAFLSRGVATGWKPPAGMRSTGVFRSAFIPGTASHFTGRPAMVYLPGAYLLKKRPKLPVLVLVAGQPGSPMSWVTAGHVQQTVDAFAARHRGLAPVVVVPDPNGSDSANTMCMNTSIAQADTYMAVDVPNWIKRTLDVDTNARHWAVGGFSFGGTCAVQMTTRHPSQYPNFIALATEREPALSVDRQTTIDVAFGGNTAAFTRLVPLTLLAQHTYAGCSGFFGAGGDDAVYEANARVLQHAAQHAGMRTDLVTYPGQQHSWLITRPGLADGLNFLARPLGLSG